MKKINSSSSIIAVQYMEEERINDGTQLELKKKNKQYVYFSFDWPRNNKRDTNGRAQ